MCFANDDDEFNTKVEEILSESDDEIGFVAIKEEILEKRRS